MKEKKHVTFNLQNNKMYYIDEWIDEYQMARKGNWEQISRDKKRFEKRIIEVYEPKLEKVLNVSHREKIYKLLHSNSK